MVDRTRLFNWYISLVAALCMVLYGYVNSVFNSLQGSYHFLVYFNEPNETLIGAVNTAYNVGAIVSGWFLAGPVADHFGRKWGMATGCILTIIATLIQTFSPRGNLACFIAGRVIIGLGQGLELTAGSVYIAELAPVHIRGRIMTCWQLFYSVGSFFAYWIGFACGLAKARLGEWDWKLVVIFQMFSPILILILLPTIPESPRWYIAHGDQIEKARATLRRVRQTSQEVEDEILVIREAVEFERITIASNWRSFYRDRTLRRRLRLAIVINIGQQLTGEGSLNSYSTVILTKIFRSAEKIAFINAFNATFAILFTCNAFWSIDKFGRKALLLIGSLGMGIAMLTISVLAVNSPDGPRGEKSNAVGIALVFLLFLFAFFFKPSWGATVWVFSVEIWSMNVRAQAVGMSTQMKNVANAVSQQFFPTILTRAGFKTFYFFFATNIALFVFVFFFIPETKGVTLEEIDELFGGSNHVEKGGELLHVEDCRHARFGRGEVNPSRNGWRIGSPGSREGVFVSQSDEILMLAKGYELDGVRR